MNKIFLLALLLITASFQLQAQDYELPNGIQLAKSVIQDGDYPIEADIFHPVGWSEDGKYAYLVTRISDPTPRHLELYILDSKTNQIVDKWAQEAEEDEEIDDRQFWDLQGEGVKKMLAAHKIKQEIDFPFNQGQKFLHGEQPYKVELLQKTGMSKTSGNEEVLSASVLLMKGDESKTELFSFTDKKRPEILNGVIKMDVLGTSINEEGTRGLVVLETHFWGFEGYTDSRYWVLAFELEPAQD